MTTSGPGPYQNEPNQPPRYDPMPTAPPVDPREGAAAPARPKSVETAFRLLMISAGLSLLVWLASMVFGGDALRESARQSVRQSGQTLSDDQIDAAVTAGLVLSGVIALAFFALYLLFAFKMRAGRNWARIVLTVLGAIDVVLTLIALSSGGDAITMVLNIAQIALVAGAIYFMFQRDSNDYFTAAQRRP